jgi:uncharacterized protein with HEPN domain
VSPRGWRFRLQDILQAISEIQSFTAGVSQEEFLKDRMRYHAVVRCLEVIGEASAHIPESIQAKYTEVAWREIKAFRNVLAHRYFSVDDVIVWDAVQMDLKPLKVVAQKILDSESN